MSFIAYCQNKKKYDESFLDSFKTNFKSSYDQSRSNQDYDKYADVAKQALAKASDTAKTLSAKTRIPLPLATALIAAGITGGPTAIPFAALLYFVKQPLMKGANKGFDATWDAGAAAVRGARKALGGQTQPQLQPESFRAFVEADSWGDWAGKKLGGVAGTVAGRATGYGSKIASSIGSRAKEIGQWAKGNPKEVARMLFLVGAGAAIGAGVGRVTHDVQDIILQKIKDQGIDPQVLSWVKQNIVLSGDGETAHGETLTSKDGQDVDHPYLINPKTGRKVYDTMNVSQNQKLISPDIFGNDGAYGQTTAVGSSGGVENVTRLDVPNSEDLRDTYRNAARVLQGEYKPGILGGIFGGEADRGDATNAMLQSSPTTLQSRIDLDRYGQVASDEIAKNLTKARADFSPDNYTTPAAIAGGVVGGTGNKKRRN